MIMDNFDRVSTEIVHDHETQRRCVERVGLVGWVGLVGLRS
jgi:hypothetical protein